MSPLTLRCVHQHQSGSRCQCKVVRGMLLEREKRRLRELEEEKLQVKAASVSGGGGMLAG